MLDSLERAQQYALPLDGMPDARVAKRSDLLHTLEAVPVIQTICVSRMAAELRHAVLEVLDQADERVDADCFGLGASPPVVAVEIAAEADTPIEAAQRDAELGGGLLERGTHELHDVTVLVRVEV